MNPDRSLIYFTGQNLENRAQKKVGANMNFQVSLASQPVSLDSNSFVINLCTKFEVRVFSRSTDRAYRGVQKA